MNMNNIISAEEISSLLRHNIFKIESYAELDSTNNALKKRAFEAEGLTIISDLQTAGKGRKNHRFFSPSGSGIYMSTLLHPKFTQSECTLITVAAAVAVCEAVESILREYSTETSVSRFPSVKWINDILIGDKKICGILAEAVFSPSGELNVILGIGINVFEPRDGYPDEIKNIAGAIFGSEEYRRGIREKTIVCILDRFFDYYEKLTDREFISEYKKRLCVFGRTITVKPNTDINYTAIPFDIDRDGRLLCRRTDTGKTEILDSGEISIKL